MSRKRSSDGDSGSSKRFKNDQPSRVVFLRNLPGMVTDAEINEVCARFGTLVNIMRLDAKNQAFIEFEHLDGAKALLRTFNGQFPIKGKIASALYSDRQYISFTRELDDNPPNRILFVIITLQIHPVDCDTLYQVFSRIGKVRKVVLQTKAVQLQGFVEMETAAQAAEAKAQFNHKHIYACSCRLSIAFAKLQTLDCSDPNYTRDYTVSEPRSSQPASSSMAITSVPQDDQFSDRRSEDSGGCVLLVNGLDDKIKPEELFNLFGTCGDVMKVKILFNKRDSALLEFRNSSQAATAREMMQGCPISGRQLHIVPSSKDSINISRADNQEADLSRDFTHCGSHRFRDENSPQFQYIRPPCEILHVSNIPPNIDEEALMDAFAPFGARHAELFKKKTTMGTVVFKSVESAVHALMAMNGWDWNTPGAKPMFLAFAKTSSGSGSASAGSGQTFSSSSPALPASTALVPLQNRVLGLPTMLEPLRDPQMGQLVPSSMVYPVYESAAFPTMSQPMQMMPMGSMQMQGMSMPSVQTVQMPQMQSIPVQQMQTVPMSQMSQLGPMGQMAPMPQMQTMSMAQVPQMAPMQTLPMAQVSQMQPTGQYQMGTLQTVQQMAPGQMQPMAQFPQANMQSMTTQFQVGPGMQGVQFVQGGPVQMVTSLAPQPMMQPMATMPQGAMGQMGDMQFQDYAQRNGLAGYPAQIVRQPVSVSQMAMIGPPPGMM